MSHTAAVSHFVTDEGQGSYSLNLLVDGMHCPSCVAIIENALHKQSAVSSARLNLSTRRLKVVWRGAAEQGAEWIALIESMGYRAAPFDPETAETQEKREEKFLLRCLAVAGFASGNLMLFSIPLWTSDAVSMGEGTRTIFHWIQALIAVPAIAYAGQPFFRSAWLALKQWHTNMDVPISVAVILATLMSLFETITRGGHAYFDSAVMLLFLLIGRFLESRARGRARSAAQDLLQMMKGFATVRATDGSTRSIPLSEIVPDMVLLVAAGEKIGADGIITLGTSDIDSSLLTGESLPQTVGPNTPVFAGTLNLSQPLEVRVTKAHSDSLLADIVRLMETAEQSQARYVSLADRLARWYTPAVHALAAITFAGWMLFVPDTTWQDALLYAATVLIITCPCALGLAVPVVQVLACGKLMRQGILLRSASALERLSGITHAVFDKTGTLTHGTPQLLTPESYDSVVLQHAASMAAQSKHPLSKALAGSYHGTLLPISIEEIQGCGLQSDSARLGKRSWALEGMDVADAPTDTHLELWYAATGAAPVRFVFADQLRTDSASIITRLQQQGITTLLLSGDRLEVTHAIAQQVGISAAEGALSPLEKTERIAALKASGAQVLMVGDGLNDAPSLSAATVSMSPASAMDITQNAADIVFQGAALAPVLIAWDTAKFSQVLVKQNFLLSILYNVVAIPLAVMGMVTPMIAAIAMSSSSLVVIANSMRLNHRKART